MKTFVNLSLLLIAVILFTVVCSIAFIYSIITRAFKPGELAAYFYHCALTLNKAGATFSKHLFNDWFVKPDGHRFGDINESASHVFGKNKEAGSLYWAGYFLAYIINAVAAGFYKDVDHIEKAADREQ